MKVGQWELLDTEQDQQVLKFAKENLPGSDAWQNNFVSYLLSFVKQKRTCIDIGSSYGFVSTALALHFDQVHSFEMLPLVYNCLLSNTKSANNIQTYNVGLGDTKRQVDINFDETFSGSSYVKTYQSELDDKCVISSTIETLDSYSFKDVDLIKIDVEGFESFVIKGSIETLTVNTPVVIIEMFTFRNKRSDLNRKDCITKMRGLGYEIVDVRQHDFVFVHKKMLVNGF